MKQHIYSSVYKNQPFPATSSYFATTEIIPIRASDNIPSLLYHFPSFSNPNCILFYFHGNGDPKWRLSMLQKIRKTFDCTICFPVYRCHDPSISSTSLPTESGMIKDIDACFKTLVSCRLLNDSSTLIFYGLSLGGAIMSSYLSAHLNNLTPKPLKIILDTTFTSMTSVFKYYKTHQDLASFIPLGNQSLSNFIARVVKILPITPLIWLYLWYNDDLYVSTKHLTRVFRNFKFRCPVLILGATKDSITPVEMSRMLVKTIVEASGGECVPELVEMECNHGCCTDVEGFYDLVDEFLSRRV
jgi:pimeloyl-ACP methyl ester carboxylesterase